MFRATAESVGCCMVAVCLFCAGLAGAVGHASLAVRVQPGVVHIHYGALVVGIRHSLRRPRCLRFLKPLQNNVSGSRREPVLDCDVGVLFRGQRWRPRQEPL